MSEVGGGEEEGKQMRSFVSGRDAKAHTHLTIRGMNGIDSLRR
jgi:hypothetical protein